VRSHTMTPLTPTAPTTLTIRIVTFTMSIPPGSQGIGRV
jgi:hypothetical protein